MESQLYNAALTIIKLGKRLQRFIQCDYFCTALGLAPGFSEGNEDCCAAPLLPVARNRVINENAAHNLRRNGKKSECDYSQTARI